MKKKNSINNKWKYLNAITAEISQIDIDWYNCWSWYADAYKTKEGWCIACQIVSKKYGEALMCNKMAVKDAIIGILSFHKGLWVQGEIYHNDFCEEVHLPGRGILGDME